MKIENPLRLRDAIEQVDYARSHDSCRHNLTGIFLEREGEDLLLIATDGHRLAQTRVRDFPLPLPSSGFLLSDTQISALRKVLHKKTRYCYPMEAELVKEPVHARGGKVSCLRLKVRGKELTLPDAGGVDFPNYRNVIPKANADEWTEELGLLWKDVAEAAEVLGTAHEKGVVTVKLTGEELILETRRELTGGSLTGRAAVKLSGPKEPREFCVCATYFAEALRHVCGGDLLVKRSGNYDPIMLRGVSDLAVVMPVRP